MGFPGEVGGRSPLGRETQVELHSPDRRTGTTIFLDRLNVNRTQDTGWDLRILLNNFARPNLFTHRRPAMIGQSQISRTSESVIELRHLHKKAFIPVRSKPRGGPCSSAVAAAHRRTRPEESSGEMSGDTTREICSNWRCAKARTLPAPRCRRSTATSDSLGISNVLRHQPPARSR
jgi:hypothetical protein